MPLIAILSRVLNESVGASVISEHPPLSLSNTNNEYHTSSYDVHKSNFIWLEDDGDATGISPTRIIGHNSYRRYVQLSPLLPFGMMLIISTIIFILIIFRRWPGLVAGIVAGSLTSISIYLLLLTLKEQRLVYE